MTINTVNASSDTWGALFSKLNDTIESVNANTLTDTMKSKLGHITISSDVDVSVLYNTVVGIVANGIVSTLNGKSGDLTITIDDVGSLSSTIAATNTAISNLDSAVQTSNGQIANLNVAVAATNTSLANINSVLVSTNNQIANINSVLVATNTSIANIYSTLSSQNSAITGIKSDLLTMNTAIVTVNNSVKALSLSTNSSVTDLWSAVNSKAANSDLTQLASKVNGFGTVVSKNVEYFANASQFQALNTVALRSTDLAPYVKIVEPIPNVPIVSGVATLAINSYQAFYVAMTGNFTVAFSNIPTGGCVSWMVTIGGNVAGTVTWPAGIKWPEAVAPAAPVVNRFTTYVFYTWDGGTTTFGFTAGSNG